jgi:hypothetical protein
MCTDKYHSEYSCIVWCYAVLTGKVMDVSKDRSAFKITHSWTILGLRFSHRCFGGFRSSGMWHCYCDSFYRRFWRTAVSSPSTVESKKNVVYDTLTLLLWYDPWRWRHYYSSKRRKSLTQRQNVTYQNLRILNLLLPDPKYEGSTIFRNVGKYLPVVAIFALLGCYAA